jgi:spore germination protein KC
MKRLAAGKAVLGGLLLMTCLLIMAGCWDMRDIDRRALIMAIGIDRVASPDARQAATESSLQVTPAQPQYKVTVEVPILKEIGSGPESQGGGSKGKPAWVLIATGSSPAQAISLMDRRIWETPFFGHTKVVVIGEETARNDIEDIVEYFRRNQEISRRLKLVIARGEAKDVIEVEPIIEDFLGIYLDNLIELVLLSGHVQCRNFSEISRDEDGNTLIPRVRPEADEVVVAGSAVMKDWRLVGWLGELETFGSLFVQNRVRYGTLVVGYPSWESGQITFSIESSKTRLKASQDDGKLQFYINIRTEGDIIEQIGGQDLDDDELLKSIQNLLQEEIQRLAALVIKKSQEEFKVDPLGLGEVVRKQLPKLWKEIEKDWQDVYFPNTTFQIKSEVKIRRTGVTQ